MILAELKRILWYQKGIVIVLAVLLFDFYWFCDKNSSFIENEQFVTLSQVYERYEGPLDEDKLKLIEADYKTCSKEGYEGLAFNSILWFAKNQLEKSSEPYLVYERGWDAIAYDFSANEPLIIIGLVLAVIAFASDAGNKVKNIVQTSVNGRRQMILSRIGVYSGIMLCFVLVQGILEFVYASTMIGTRCLDAPVQSFMLNCTMDITLIQAYALVLFLRYIGVLLAGVIVCLVASVTKNMYMSIIVGALVFFEGYFFSYIYEWEYLLPEHLIASYMFFEGANLVKTLCITLVTILILLGVICHIENESSRRKLV